MPFKSVPWLHLGIALALFLSGWQVSSWRSDAVIARLNQAAAAASKKASEKARLLETQSAELAHAVSARYAAEAAAANMKTETITKKVIEYVEAPYAGHCDMPNGWVRLDTAAATGMPPDDSTFMGIDAAPSGITDAEALEVITERSRICRGELAKLVSLQAYVTDQLSVFNPKAERPP